MAKKLRRMALLEKEFPKLKRPGSYGRTSPATDSYNCVAFAAGVTSTPWCPYRYWPPRCPVSSHFQCLHGVFNITQGYAPCDSGEHEEGFEKIAIYANGMDDWMHAARQLRDGWWTSKLGDGVDIIHEKAQDLEGTGYGTIRMFLKRPVDPPPAIADHEPISDQSAAN